MVRQRPADKRAPIPSTKKIRAGGNRDRRFDGFSAKAIASSSLVAEAATAGQTTHK
jgi:hypothetical protein